MPFQYVLPYSASGFIHTSLHSTAAQSLIQSNHTLDFGEAVRHL